MSDDAIPEIIRVAGERAVAAYRTFFDVIKQGSHARDVYQDACGRFCKWAEGRRLTLAGLTAADAYTKAANTASPTEPIRLDLTALRSLFQHFARAGVLASNPFENPAERLKPSMPTGIRPISRTFAG